MKSAGGWRGASYKQNPGRDNSDRIKIISLSEGAFAVGTVEDNMSGWWIFH